MTAPASVHPRTAETLLPDAKALTARLGKTPTRNQLMKEFKIGAPKATALIELLTAKPTGPVFDYPDPIGPNPAPDTEPTDPADDFATGYAAYQAVRQSRTGHPPARVDYGLVDVAREVVDGVREAGSTITGPPTEPGEEPQVAVDGHPGSNITTDPAKVGPATDKTTRRRSIPGRVWAYIGVALGGVVSIAANVAHTYLPKPPPGAPEHWTAPVDWSPPLLAVAFSVFWPIALFVAVEILTRITWGDGFWSMVVRVVGVLPVALVAAVVSYRHLSGLLDHFGEDDLTVAIGPLAIDGLMVMASAALMATNRKRTKTS